MDIMERNISEHGLDSKENGDVEMCRLRRRTNGEIIHDELEHTPTGWMERTMSKMSGSTEDFIKNNSPKIRITALVLLNSILFSFFFGALYYFIEYDTSPLQLCEGFGSLIALYVIVYFFIIYFRVIKKYFGNWFEKVVWNRFEKTCQRLWRMRFFPLIFILVILTSVAVFLYFDTEDNRERLVSLLGVVIIMLLGFIFSAHPGRINWRTVFVGLALQFIFGLIFIRWEAGRYALQCFSDKVAVFLNYGTEGAAFVFGDFLVNKEKVFAFSTLPVIFFFSMLVEVLFFYGALQWFCLKLGHLLRAATSTTVCESVISVGNVFLGMSESVLLIKPYIELLTPSEIHVIMASGFATVSGTILAAYIGFGAEPAHLVTASVMSAPAAICYSKLLMPETKKSLTAIDNIAEIEIKDQSALSAATRGATNGIGLVLNIVANLVAFVSVIAFINGVLGYSGLLLGFDGFNLEWIFGKVFIPFAWIMGVPWDECELVGSLIGLKTVVNEFVAYQRMGEMLDKGLLSTRSELIATYALCGFTNPSSAGIMIGALSAMAPNQRETLSKTAVRAFFAGCGICFMTASIAALLMPEGSFVRVR